ncbi:hypothetical protein ABZ883_23165 [Streptomyces sp. NPDC046977]|uniref:hypothetical protein n=1 Tax=Streptomyces sp. NPDC046977 TaxID=3154703 RepID=UPI0034048175
MSSPPLRKPPRWVQWTVVPLLIVVPVFYVLISAEQSRDGGEQKQKLAAATTLTYTWPTKVQRRIYDVPIPPRSRPVAFLETNNWAASSLYVQFTTSQGGLDTFLAQVGSSRAALKDGEVTVSRKQASTVRWAFGSGQHWAGTRLQQHGDKPDHDITVDLTSPDAPVVYVVSTMDFA